MDVKKEFYVNEVSLDNGTHGITWSKTQTPPYAAGDVVTYDEQPIQTGGTFFKGMKKLESPARDKAIIYQNAFTQANTFLSVVGYEGETKEEKLSELIDMADLIASNIMLKSGI